MTRLNTIPSILAVIGAAVAAASVHAEEPLVTPAVTTTFVLCAATDCRPQLRIPIRARANVNALSLTVAITGVRRDNLQDTDFAKLLMPTLEGNADGPPTAILVTGASAPMATAGTYAIDISVTTKTGDSASFTVNATRAAGQLETPPTLHLERVFHFPWQSSFTDSYAPLALAESSKAGAVSITPSEFRLKQPTVNGTTAVTGKLVLPGVLTIPQGQSGQADLKVEGEFPLGLNTGAMLLTSPQLAAPLTLNFDVKSRLSTAHIFLIVAVGLLVSRFVKVKLQGDVDRAAAAVHARQLLDQMTMLRGRHLSTSLVTGPVGGAEVALKNTLVDPHTDAKAIDDKREALERAFQTAFNALPAARALVQPRVDALRGLVEAPWPGPPAIVQALRNVVPELQRIGGLLQMDDPEGAEAATRTLTVTLVGDVLAAFDHWKKTLSTDLREIGLTGPGRSAAVLNTTGPAVVAAADALKALAAIGPTDDPPALTTKLNAMLGARTLATDALSDVADALEQEADTAVALLHGRSTSQPDPLPALKAAASDVVTILRRVADNPDAWTGQGPALLTALDAAWRTAVLDITPPASLAGVTNTLDARQYLTATRDAIAAQSAALGVQNDDPLRRQTAPRFLPAFRRGVAADGTIAVPFFASFHRPPAADGFAVVPAAAVAADRLQRVKGLQTLIVGGLLLLLGYSMFQAKFVGTWDDVLMIFFWAFGLDLAVDTVLKLAKKP